MANPKQVNLFGMLAKLEPSYDGGGALSAATDGCWLQEPFEASISYVHDGARIAQAPGSGNTFKRLEATGIIVEGSPKFEARGSGAAYTGSVFPPDVHVWLRASGHSATLSGGAGVEQYLYAPQSLNDSTWGSIVMEGYGRNQKYPVQGVYADCQFEVDGNGPMVFTFPFKGIGTLPTDVTLPSITYQAISTLPPKAESAALTFNGVSTLVVRNVKFAKNQVIAGPRASQTSAGKFAGFAMGGRNPTFEVTVEAIDLATLNPYALRDAATSFAISYTIGAINLYNQIIFVANQAQVVEVEDDSDGPTALWRIVCELKPSSPILSDDYSIEWSD